MDNNNLNFNPKKFERLQADVQRWNVVYSSKLFGSICE